MCKTNIRYNRSELHSDGRNIQIHRGNVKNEWHETTKKRNNNALMNNQHVRVETISYILSRDNNRQQMQGYFIRRPPRPIS